jgi:hypothetical protein
MITSYSVFSSNIIIVIKPRRMKWADHAARRVMKNACKLLAAKSKEIRSFWKTYEIGSECVKNLRVA